MDEKDTASFGDHAFLPEELINEDGDQEVEETEEEGDEEDEDDAIQEGGFLNEKIFDLGDLEVREKEDKAESRKSGRRKGRRKGGKKKRRKGKGRKNGRRREEGQIDEVVPPTNAVETSPPSYNSGFRRVHVIL